MMCVNFLFYSTPVKGLLKSSQYHLSSSSKISEILLNLWIFQLSRRDTPSLLCKNITILSFYTFSSIQFSHSVVSDSLRPHGLQHTRLPCPSQPPELPKLMFIGLVMPSNHLILCRPLLLLPSIFPSIRVFSSESVLLIRWPEYAFYTFTNCPFLSINCI